MAWTKAGREHEKEMEQMRLVAEADRLQHYVVAGVKLPKNAGEKFPLLGI